MAEFRLLGPVEVRAADRPLDLGAAKLRTVLAILMINLGRPITLNALISRVWDENPPPAARSVLYAHLSRIRRVFSEMADAGGKPIVLRRHSGGYSVQVDHDLVDVHRFQSLIEQSRSPNPGRDTRQHATLLTEAVQLWRGTALEGVPGDWAERVRMSLEQQRLDALIRWADAKLRLGQHLDVIGQLRAAAAQYPLVEPLIAHLMRALYLADRGAEALELHARSRRRLVDELGTEPGREICDVHQVVLRGNPVDPPASVSEHTQPQPLKPALLPLDVHGFTGRSGALADLDAVLASADEQPTAVVISALSGTAGVGKSALALHWAHRVAYKFPDGQLYVNLRGFDTTGVAMTPAEAVRGFLDALGIPPPRIPSGLPAQIDLYRTLLAGKRMLIMLDNAHDAGQIRTLLPGAPGCLVIVTSRNQLTSLVAADGAHPLTLDLLAADEARELLSRRVGADRMTSEPQAVNAIVTLCARLPLALAIVAARAITQPHRSLETLAVELRKEQGRLDALAGGEEITDLRAVFSWSYRTLSHAAARLFRLLSLHPGLDIAAPAAASLAYLPLERIRPLLAELTMAHMINEQSADRYACHDLLRAYAAELARTLESAAERRVALHRILDHYLHTAYAADRLLNPTRDPIDLPPPRPGVSPEHITDSRHSLAWFTVEHPVLLDAVEEAAAGGFDTHTTQIVWTLRTFLDRQGHWQDWATTQAAALGAFQRLNDRLGQARTRHDLGQALHPAWPPRQCPNQPPTCP